MAKPTATIADVTLTRDTAAPSFAGTGTLYAVGQCRVIDENRIRYQVGSSEWVYSATPEITGWLAKVPAGWPSKAHSASMYVPCLLRSEAPMSMRVQVPTSGPGLNREWGAEWIHKGPCPADANSIILAATPQAAEPSTDLTAGGTPPKPKPEPDPDEDDETDDDDDETEN